MSLHPLAGQPVPRDMLINVPRLVAAYYSNTPDPSEPTQQVSFGTSGHRGSALTHSFNEAHILAITQALCEHRAAAKVTGPLFLGMDTHALSEPAMISTIEVCAAHGVTLMIQKGRGYTPTPVISHAILTYNRNRQHGHADGVVITPSHNPPGDGGFKYNPPSGGPADASTTQAIQKRANEILSTGLKEVSRIPFTRAMQTATTHEYDYVRPYVDDLSQALDMASIADAKLSIGVDPLGGSGIAYWEPIAERYGLNIEVVNPAVDPQFGFMRLDKDGVVRMDCSSPYAMAGLIALRDRFDIAFGNDPDYDRHGIVTRDGGLLNPNHYLSVAIDYLFKHRPNWPAEAAVGKTVVSSAMIDRVTRSLARPLCEVPVGFKWFVDGLLDGSYGFGGEESAGASFLRRDGSVWTTDKDGILLDLLAAEIMAKTGESPSQRYQSLVTNHGQPTYERMDAPATMAQKAALKKLSPEALSATTLAGEPIVATLTHAPGNGAAIGGLKVVTDNGWFAARPSGTENIYKIYAESFLGSEHLSLVQEEAKEIVQQAFVTAGA